MNFFKKHYSALLVLTAIVFIASMYSYNQHQINTYFANNDDHFNGYACGIYLSRDTINNITIPKLISDIDHKPLNIDTVYLDPSGYIMNVKLKDTFKYVTVGMVGTDESTISIVQLLFGKVGEPDKLPGGYKVGASVGAGVLKVSMSRTGCLCGFIRWDTTNGGKFIQEAYTPRFATLNSTPFDVSFNSVGGYMDIKTHNVIEMTGIPTGYVQLNNGNSAHDIDARFEYMSKTWTRVYLLSQNRDYTIDSNTWQITAGPRKKVTVLPHNMVLNFNFGNADIPINIRDTRFGTFANLWVWGLGAGRIGN